MYETSAPYSRKRPSPPPIRIQLPASQPRSLQNGVSKDLVMLPSYEDTDPSQLNSDDLAIITRNQVQVATNLASNWNYEQRRTAQPILDFLYLGPNAAIRDLELLRREGITMVIMARDPRLASTTSSSIDKASQQLGVIGQYFDVSQDLLVRGFPEIIRAINNHLLTKYHEQAQERRADGQVLVDPNSFTRGKVLVTCETGNDASAAIVAAYIMAVFGKDLETTLQFITIQRFCCCYDEEKKRLLTTWEEIVRARTEVARNQMQLPQRPARPKRSVDDLLRSDPDHDTEMGGIPTDEDRFNGRKSFAPFVDGP